MKPYSIIWSPRARITYFQILEYLDSNWTKKEVGFFVNRANEVKKHLIKNPLLYAGSVKANIHRCVVVKQVSLFYRVKDNNVEFIVFWDNRQDPAKLLL